MTQRGAALSELIFRKKGGKGQALRRRFNFCTCRKFPLGAEILLCQPFKENQERVDHRCVLTSLVLSVSRQKELNKIYSPKLTAWKKYDLQSELYGRHPSTPPFSKLILRLPFDFAKVSLRAGCSGWPFRQDSGQAFILNKKPPLYRWRLLSFRKRI